MNLFIIEKVKNNFNFETVMMIDYIYYKLLL